jgi:uncharacterized protein YbjT (DUF2867 family)
MVQLDHSNEENLALALRGVQHVILAIGFEVNRVELCKKIIQRAGKSGVKSIIVVSQTGAMSSTHEALKQFSEVEEELFSTDMDTVILRYNTCLLGQ